MDKLKTKVQNIDWWELGYFILYGAIFTYSFLDTTMFEIHWPPRFGYIFLIASGLFIVAKFIWHNTYTKKEMILAAVIVISFVLSGIIADYSFLIWTGFLIVGAKDVDFNKILRVYLAIGITIMLAAFVASQMGWIENLQYTVNRDDTWVVRNSFGSVYPTDFSAHIFYLAAAGVCLSENKLTWGKIVNFLVLAVFVLDKCGARTSAICMLLMAVMLLFVKMFKNKIKTNVFYHIMNLSMVALASVFFSLVYIYDITKEWTIKLDEILSNRLSISNKALDLYDYKLFGQNIIEIGMGRDEIVRDDYFFLDSTYIRIALLYGLVLLIVTLLIFWIAGKRAIANKRFIIVVAIAVIAVHGFMEHHILEIAYNPILCFLFARCNKIEIKNKLEESNVS